MYHRFEFWSEFETGTGISFSFVEILKPFEKRFEDIPCNWIYFFLSPIGSFYYSIVKATCTIYNVILSILCFHKVVLFENLLCRISKSKSSKLRFSKPFASFLSHPYFPTMMVWIRAFSARRELTVGCKIFKISSSVLKKLRRSQVDTLKSLCDLLMLSDSIILSRYFN